MPPHTPPPFRHAGFRGRIGIARRDITPPVGIYARNWGAAQHDVAESIHRPLTVSVLTLSTFTEDSPLVLVDADLSWWQTPQVFEKFRSFLLQELKLTSSRLILALSHSHAAPPLAEVDPTLPGADIHRSWLESVPKTIVEAVREARQESFDGLLEFQTGRCGLAAVRDLPDPDESNARYLCGYSPSGHADDTMLVGRISDHAGKIRGVMVNYACHPTTLAWQNKAISPDYPGAMRETIEAATGATAFFLLGACGELAPRHQYVADTAIPDQHGRELGYAALSTLAGMQPPATALTFAGAVESGAPLAVWTPQPADVSQELRTLETKVELPLQNWPTAAELEQQRRDCTDRAIAERLRRKRDIRKGLGDGNTYELSLTAWKLGDVILLGNCCEAYSLLQQELRSRFPETWLIYLNLINGSLGYLPPSELYDQNIYPVWQTPFARGSLELTLQTFTNVIHELLR
ncbi:alkaline ceramidase [Planctomicrobium sp. SH661]|uniref:alkaline ceramidase n=1 Tax=Planctomicrobium sp. SH661 TaxID=3448124 RepID=UPI003F5B6D08